MKTYDQISGQSIHRIEALSDGVFAIALTLLVLDIRVPISNHISTDKDLMNAFGTLAPKLLAYFLSFMTLGIFWTAHSSQFHFIEKSDRNFNWLNLSFLLFVTIIPFTTAFLSEYIMFKFAIGVYWLNLFLMGLMLTAIVNYAYSHNYIKSVHLAQKTEIKKAMMRRGIIAQSLYAIGAVSCFISTYISITILTAIQLYFVLALFSKKKANKVFH
jgi:Predicted integral membrane protein